MSPSSKYGPEVWLRRIIRAAFEGAAIPDCDEVIGPSAYDHEAQAMRRSLVGRHWLSLGGDDLLNHSDHLWLLTPKAFAYYLPAYLLAGIDYEAEHQAGPTIVSHLVPAEGAEGQTSFDALTVDVTAQQARAVLSFLSYLWTRYPGQPTLAAALQYWRRRTGDEAADSS